MTAWELLTLFFSLITDWQSYYNPAESGEPLRSMVMYALQGLRAFHNCSIAPYAFAFDSSVCWGFVEWLK